MKEVRRVYGDLLPELAVLGITDEKVALMQLLRCRGDVELAAGACFEMQE